MLGSKSHSCTANGWGRSDQGGEQTWGSEHNGMTAAPRMTTREKSLYGKDGGKADPLRTWRRPMISWEETGECTMENRRGKGPDTQGKICGDNTGKVQNPTGTGDNLQRPFDEARAEGEGRVHGLAHESV